MIRIFTFAAFALTLFSAPAKAEFVSYKELPAGIYEIDETHASLTWKVFHMGLAKYTSRFTTFNAEIDFKPNNPEQSTVKATIDVRSLKTDYPYPKKKDFDKKLIEDQSWFFAANFPNIYFKSKSLVINNDNTGVLTGELEMLGKTKPVTLQVTFNGAYDKKPFVGVPAMGFSAVGEINRSDWGFDTYIPSIADKVEFAIEAEFHKKADAEE